MRTDAYGQLARACRTRRLSAALTSMTNLHGILAELGIVPPALHSEREVPHPSGWAIDCPFAPVVGRRYEIALVGAFRHERRKVRIDGPAPADWFDLDRERPLDPTLGVLPVKAFRRID